MADPAATVAVPVVAAVALASLAEVVAADRSCLQVMGLCWLPVVVAEVAEVVVVAPLPEATAARR
jgi:hypothetical protein